VRPTPRPVVSRSGEHPSLRMDDARVGRTVKETYRPSQPAYRRTGELKGGIEIFVAGVALIGALMSMAAYPFWSLTLVAIDVLIIYGLAAYGGKPELT
jgi:hypothetical protein